MNLPAKPSTTPESSASSPLGAKPVPTFAEGTNPRHHFDRERQLRFLALLSDCGNVRAACRALRLSAQTAYRARRQCPELRMAWDAAMLLARVHAEEVLADRALNGVEEAVYYHGEEVARRTRFDSRLLLAHLARLDRLEADGYVVEVSEDFERALARFGRGDPLHVDPLSAHCYEEEGDRELFRPDDADPDTF